MAEGRMLKKNVSTSRKLASLKSDSARLLWTWILPHLDVAGRFLAEPDVVKGSVVPRLKHFTELKIQELLQELHNVGLIIIYEVDGERYLELQRFEDFQNLRTDRESESKIPKPVDSTLFGDTSRSSPGVLPESSTAVRDKDKDKDRDKDRDKNFAAWWERYPRKVEKTPAFEAYTSALKEAAPEDLLRALDGYLADIAENKTEKKYIKHAATFLHKNRWRDYLERPGKTRKKITIIERDGTMSEKEIEE